MKIFICLLFPLFFSCSSITSNEFSKRENKTDDYHIVPKPSKLIPGQGAFLFSGNLQIEAKDFDKEAELLQEYVQSDFQKVTGVQPNLVSQNSGVNGMMIIIGEAGKSKTIDNLIRQKKIIFRTGPLANFCRFEDRK